MEKQITVLSKHSDNNWKLYGYQKQNKETINNIVVLVTEQNTNKCSIEICTEWNKKTKLDNFSTDETQSSTF